MSPQGGPREDENELREGEELPPPGVRTMAIVRWALVVVMGLVAVGSVASYFGLSLSRGGAEATGRRYYCPMHPQIVQDHPGECPICSMTLVLKPAGRVQAAPTMPPPAADAAGLSGGTYWCPMHPQVTSNDSNATCPLCGGMKLVPKPAGAAPGSTVASEPVPGLVPVDLPVDRIQRSGVRTAVVTRGSLVSELRTVGAVEASERGLAQISPRFAGWIEELFVNETGQRVKRGQALATIYSPDVLQAQQEMLSALGWSDRASPPLHGNVAPLASMVADARHRLELLGISPQEIDALIASRQPKRAIAIRSPVEGHVIAKSAVIGMNVAAGTPLFQVADLSTVWVIADVYEGDVQRVRVGQPARFETSSYAGAIFKGKVSFIYPTLDPSSRTLRLRLEFRNRPDPRSLKLRPGMYGNVLLDLETPGLASGLTIPADALIDTGDLQYVFVAQDQGRFEPRRVKVGGRLGDRFEVLSGVTEGEKVVTSANFLIDSESRLRAAIEGAPPAPSIKADGGKPAHAH